MCLTITRTKAPKRSRAAPSKTTTTSKKTFTPTPIPSFQKSLEQSNVALAMPAVGLSDMTLSPTIFDDDVTPQQQCMTDNYSSMKGPLHKATTSVFPLSNLQTASNPVFTQQTTNTQQLDSSVVNTCQWLINAGVPMSAFDPVAIGDTLNSTPLCVPQVGLSTPSTFAPAIPQTSNTLPVVMKENVAVPTQLAPVATTLGGNTQHLNLNCGNDISTIFSMDLPTVSNSVSPTHEEELCFDDDHFLNDLLPGEGLVDESLWAL